MPSDEQENDELPGEYHLSEFVCHFGKSWRLLHYCISALLMESPDSEPFLSPHKPHPEIHGLMIDVSCLFHGSYQKFAKLSIIHFSQTTYQIIIKRLIGLQSPVIPMIMAFDIDVI